MLFDILGALASLLSTYFFIRMNNKAWPIGMLATALNGWLYWYKGIYADMLLEGFYFISMCYGWYLWRNPVEKLKTAAPTLNTYSLRQWLHLPLILGAGFCTIYFFLKSYTSSNVAFMDAATTTLSLMAQWLMCHKIIITWLLWFITDAMYAFMYLSKELPFHSVLMLVYTGMAITGYLVWAKRGANEIKSRSGPWPDKSLPLS